MDEQQHRKKQLNEQFLRAARDGNIAAARQTLTAGAEVDAVDPTTGLRAYHFAVCFNDLPLARCLAEEWQASVLPTKDGRWPTLLAAQRGASEALSDFVLEKENEHWVRTEPGSDEARNALIEFPHLRRKLN